MLLNVQSFRTLYVVKCVSLVIYYGISRVCLHAVTIATANGILGKYVAKCCFLTNDAQTIAHDFRVHPGCLVGRDSKLSTWEHLYVKLSNEILSSTVHQMSSCWTKTNRCKNWPLYSVNKAPPPPSLLTYCHKSETNVFSMQGCDKWSYSDSFILLAPVSPKSIQALFQFLHWSALLLVLASWPVGVLKVREP